MLWETGREQCAGLLKMIRNDKAKELSLVHSWGAIEAFRKGAL